jgi:hypothetical protein
VITLADNTPRGRRVRTYAITGGRTRPDHPLSADTVVSVPAYDPAVSAGLLPEERALYERAREPISVADLTAGLTILPTVIQILLGDLVTADRMVVHSAGAAAVHYDRDVLGRILDGLKELQS